MWARLINCGIGIWLMAAPAVLGYGGTAAVNDRVVGPVVASVACIALWEVTRPLRRLGLPLGLWLLVAPFVLGFPRDAMLNSVLSGMAIAGLSMVRGRRTHAFGGGWRTLLPGRAVPR
jgi:hypothetical protein